jgi:hypothetical protein
MTRGRELPSSQGGTSNRSTDHEKFHLSAPHATTTESIE